MVVYFDQLAEMGSDNTSNYRAEQGTTLLGIEWAPLNIPWTRRMETFSAFFWFFCIYSGLFINFYSLYYILCTSFWPIGILYVSWIYYDRNTAHTGGRSVRLIKKFKLWQYFRDYFPIRLIKTADLDADENYLFCVYPHGVLASGAVLNFATDANKFERVYPGLEAHLLTLSLNFNLPFSRETILGLGGCSVAEKSIMNLLGKERCGKVGVLVVGGAAESLKTEPGTYRIVIKNRKGFVRVALKAGAHLVPVISFGENDMFGQYKSAAIHKIQHFFYRLVGFVPIFPRGRGFFQYCFGIVPHRRPINTVVGKAIPIPQISNPTKEDIDTYHQKFMDEIEILFNENKAKYDANGDAAELIME